MMIDMDGLIQFNLHSRVDRGLFIISSESDLFISTCYLPLERLLEKAVEKIDLGMTKKVRFQLQSPGFVMYIYYIYIVYNNPLCNNCGLSISLGFVYGVCKPTYNNWAYSTTL